MAEISTNNIGGAGGVQQNGQSGSRVRKLSIPSIKVNEKNSNSGEGSPSCFKYFASRSFRNSVLPKVFYLVFQDSFMAVILALNWDFLTTETDGQILFALTIICGIGTHIFYFLTGSIDPGYVKNQIFDNQIETTEFVDEDGSGVSPSKLSHAAKMRKIRSTTRARKPSTVLTELDKDTTKSQNQAQVQKQQEKTRSGRSSRNIRHQESNQLFCGAYTSNDNLVLHDSVEQISHSNVKLPASESKAQRQVRKGAASGVGGLGSGGDHHQLQQAANRQHILIDQEEQGDMRVSIYYTSGEGESSQQIDLNQIELVESVSGGAGGKSSRRQSFPQSKSGNGAAAAQSGRVASSFDAMSPGRRINSRYNDQDGDGNDDIQMCEEGRSDSLDNTEMNNFFNEESREVTDRLRNSTFKELPSIQEEKKQEKDFN